MFYIGLYNIHAYLKSYIHALKQLTNSIKNRDNHCKFKYFVERLFKHVNEYIGYTCRGLFCFSVDTFCHFYFERSVHTKYLYHLANSVFNKLHIVLKRWLIIFSSLIRFSRQVFNNLSKGLRLLTNCIAGWNRVHENYVILGQRSQHSIFFTFIINQISFFLPYATFEKTI